MKHLLEHALGHTDFARMYGNELKVGEGIGVDGLDRRAMFALTR